MSHWYVIQSFPLAEKRAVEELRRAGLRVFIPKRTYEVRDRNAPEGMKMRFRPLLIGYVFIRFPPELLDRYGRPHLALVRECQSVRCFVRVADAAGEWRPIEIPDKEVAGFLRRQRRREFGRPVVVNRKDRFAGLAASFKPGNQHRIVHGPFAQFLATLEQLNENMTINAEVMIFGRPTRINIGVEDVEPKPEKVAA